MTDALSTSFQLCSLSVRFVDLKLMQRYIKRTKLWYATTISEAKLTDKYIKISLTQATLLLRHATVSTACM